MLTFATALRTSRVQLLADAIDAGSAGAATLKLYGGTRPGSGGNVSDQPLLIILPLATPCAQSVTGGVLTLKAIAEAMVSGNGTITWGRFSNRDGGFVADLDAGLTGSGADLEIPVLEVYQGAYIRINNATVTEP
ncbi:hypothetical protein CF139_14990 [Aeromonas hydrophila]|uniref:hypothetical protein n=1 Tax=Aeromonas hydrophila TaxID=644 RepID=UPI00111662DC|nr:hypothetical protein [Aeromonas hydrophila]TNH86826.1 hypothetical protein CF139_14990 [Aeromonas hydrophila]